MYEKHFGLKKRPFRANAQGTDVFVGPQSAAAMAAIKKALKSEEAVVAISGPAGVGKTTIGKRALDGVGDARIIVTVGRMQLGIDEVLELLLAGLGARQLPKSTVHRFALFRRMLQQYGEKNKRVVVVVEDATRAGTGALSELEALTAADAGVSDGANIVLMADTGIAELLREPALARLKQRVRLRQSIQPLDVTELRGYLQHSFRLAGGEFDTIFAAGAAEMLHGLSDGVPRIVNNLVEAALTSAAENNQQQVSVESIKRIASEEFGLTAEHSVAEIEQFVAAADAKTAADVEVIAKPEVAAEEPPVVVEPTPVVAEPPKTVAQSVQVVEEPPRVVAEPPKVVEEAVPAIETPEASDEEDIPELIQDTLPDLQILAPDLVNLPETSDPEDIPTLFNSTAPEQAVTPAPTDNLDEAIAELPELPIAPVAEPVAKPVAKPAAKPVAKPAAEPVAKPAAEPVAKPAAEPVAKPAAKPAAEPVSEDTATELTILEPPVAEAAVEEAKTEQPAAAADEEIPEWERDPTLAQLRPDLDALDRAMAVAQGTAPEAEQPASQPDAAEQEEDIPTIVPEITLDKQIEAKIEEATEALRQTNFDIEVDEEQLAKGSADKLVSAKSKQTRDDNAPAVDAGQASAEKQFENDFGKNTQEIKDIASGIARAKTIEDVDDQLAETLFGAEFSAVAADVVAKASRDLPANDEIELEPEDKAEAAVAPRPVDPKGAAAIGAQPEPEPSDPHGNVDNSPSMRLATLRELNAAKAPAGAPPTPEPAESIVLAADPTPPMPASLEGQPDSIEDQINTSMTQTLKALAMRPEDMPDDDEDDEKKGGFFSRFRRS